MHELGIIVHISKTLDEIAVENGLTQIGRVTLEIGEVSAIVPSYLTDCWAYYRRSRPLIAEAMLEIETLPAVTTCRSCGQNYATVQYGRRCPHCLGWDTYLLTGDECRIKEIEAC